MKHKQQLNLRASLSGLEGKFAQLNTRSFTKVGLLLLSLFNCVSFSALMPWSGGLPFGLVSPQIIEC